MGVIDQLLQRTPERDPKGRLKAGGPSLNPLGRPKRATFAEMIRASTDGGRELLESALATLRDPKSRERDRHAVREWLANYMIGKPVQPSENVNVNLTAGSDEEPEHLDLGRLSDGAFTELAALVLERPEQLPAQLTGPVIEGEIVSEVAAPLPALGADTTATAGTPAALAAARRNDPNR